MTALPPIRYAQSADGSRIAFNTLGGGPAVVMLFPYHVNHLTLQWRVPLHRRAMEFFARWFTVVNLDLRGAGESERDGVSVSLGAFGEDIDAVLDALGIQSTCLCAMGPAALTACHYAARNPQRVAAITFIQGGESAANLQVLALRQHNTELEARLRGALLGGTNDKDNAAALADVARNALRDDALAAWERVLRETRLQEVAQRVAAPCLCVHAAGDDLIPLAAGESLAASLQNATLRAVPADTGMQIWRDEAALEAAVAFFGAHSGIEVERKGSPRSQPRKTYPARLTAREAEVLRLIAAGKTNRQIAADLFISLNTVAHHLRSIFAKTRSTNRTEAAGFAHQHELS
jgi:DNA-binding CsgD family transcriptional regulator/pimeloyl-ACP methyl ester carboxylesterase